MDMNFEDIIKAIGIEPYYRDPSADIVHCRTCQYLHKYNGTVGYNPVSKAGWCSYWGRLRFAQKVRMCQYYVIDPAIFGECSPAPLKGGREGR